MKTDLSDFEKELAMIAKKIEQISENHEYDFGDIFPKQFMLHYTNSSSIDNFLINSPHKIKSQEEFKQLPTETMDNYVFENTPFNNWKDMHQKAVKIYLAKRLGL